MSTGTTIGAETFDPNNLSAAKLRYQKVMDFLKAEEKRNSEKSRLDTYIGKQTAYTAIEEKKITAFDGVYHEI